MKKIKYSVKVKFESLIPAAMTTVQLTKAAPRNHRIFGRTTVTPCSYISGGAILNLFITSRTEKLPSHSNLFLSFHIPWFHGISVAANLKQPPLKMCFHCESNYGNVNEAVRTGRPQAQVSVLQRCTCHSGGVSAKHSQTSPWALWPPLVPGCRENAVVCNAIPSDKKVVYWNRPK